MVSKASEDLPEPLKPVMTTSLSRGILSVRFLRLCSRAPPILINSLLTDPDFSNKPIGKPTKSTERTQRARRNFFPADLPSCRREYFKAAGIDWAALQVHHRSH